jgi:hypothetical protein
LTLADFNHGKIWLSKMITIIWTHCHQLWESRNTDKHGHDSEMQQKILLEQVQRLMAVMYKLNQDATKQTKPSGSTQHWKITKLRNPASNNSKVG